MLQLWLGKRRWMGRACRWDKGAAWVWELRGGRRPRWPNSRLGDWVMFFAFTISQYESMRERERERETSPCSISCRASDWCRTGLRNSLAQESYSYTTVPRFTVLPCLCSVFTIWCFYSMLGSWFVFLLYYQSLGSSLGSCLFTQVSPQRIDPAWCFRVR